MSLQQDIKSHRLAAQEIDENFADIAPLLTDKQVLVASERCLFCYDAPCIKACPTSIDIPLFIRKINSGNAHGAAKEILSANILGGSCARVCPTETLCEEACVRNTHEDAPVAIGRLQRYAVEHLDAARGYPFTRAADTGKHIAIVGAGPAGLACAHRLAREGHSISIYEAKAKPGGLNEYGIAKYKLVNDYAQQEVDFVLQIGGIEINYNSALGRDISLSELRKQHDAVFLSMGMQDVNNLNIEGEALPGVEDAVAYIETLRQSKDLSQLPVGNNVIVIGAGMTAIDIAVQSKKLGAQNVTIAYRRDRAAMGASAHEQDLAQRHGVQFICHAQPHKIIGSSAGISSMEFKRTKLDAQGALHSSDETFSLPCDMVFKAIGQQFKPGVFDPDSLPELDRRGRIAVNERFLTSLANVYAGGDCINGKDLVVEAVDHGNKAAMAIHQQLKEAL